MKKIYLKLFSTIILLHYCSFLTYGQNATCDSALIFELRDVQLKTADKIFNKVYEFKRETFPYDITQAGSAAVDTNYKEVCTDIFYWDGPPLKSTLARMANPGDNKLYVYCTISIPVINKKKNHFRIQMLSFFGSWGSRGETFYYRKRFGKWKLYKTNLIFKG